MIIKSFSLDNPGFLTIGEDLDNALDNPSQPMSGSSSSVPSSGESSRWSCPRCHWRMSSYSVDRHSICCKCRGNDCTIDCRCDECLSWSMEEMESYVKLRKSLASKGKKKSFSTLKTPSSSGPQATSVVVDEKIRAHIATFSWDVDDRLASLSSSLMSRLDELFVSFRSNVSNLSLPAEPEVLGLTPPTGQSPPLRRSVSTHVNPMRFQSDVGGQMPQSSGSAHTHSEAIQLGDSQGPAPRPHVSTEATEPAHAAHSARSDRVRFESSSDLPVFVREPEDEDEDDQESVVDFPLDKTFNCLINYIYEQYPDSRPHSDPAVPPRCEFESFFATSDPQSAVRQKLCWYTRVQEITAKTQERAQRLARENKSAQKMIPLHRRSFPVADDPDYAAPRWLNQDFTRLAQNKSIAKSHAGMVSFSDMERLERTSRTAVEGFSQSYWLLSSLPSQLKQDRYRPSEPALFDKTIQSLSSSMALQTSLVSRMTDFLVSKCWELFLSHVSVPLSALQKRELQVASSSGDFLFDQELLEKTSGQVKEDSIISSMSLSRLARSGFEGKRSASDAPSSSRAESSRSGSSFGKCFGSPTRGSSAKRFRGGRGKTQLCLGKVFRSRSHVPVWFP